MFATDYCASGFCRGHVCIIEAAVFSDFVLWRLVYFVLVT